MWYNNVARLRVDHCDMEVGAAEGGELSPDHGRFPRNLRIVVLTVDLLGNRSQATGARTTALDTKPSQRS